MGRSTIPYGMAIGIGAGIVTIVLGIGGFAIWKTNDSLSSITSNNRKQVADYSREERWEREDREDREDIEDREEIEEIEGIQENLTNEADGFVPLPGLGGEDSVAEYPSSEGQPIVEEYPGSEEQPIVEEYPGSEEQPIVEEYQGTEEQPYIAEYPNEGSNYYSEYEYANDGYNDSYIFVSGIYYATDENIPRAFAPSIELKSDGSFYMYLNFGDGMQGFEGKYEATEKQYEADDVYVYLAVDETYGMVGDTATLVFSDGYDYCLFQDEGFGLMGYYGAPYGFSRDYRD